MNIPIIKLEVEGMRHTVMCALMEHQAKMDASIQAAIDAACTPENIDRVVQEAAGRALKEVIQAEVAKFFNWGPGREVVAAAVKAKLLAGRTGTPLDEVEPQ
jgi:hypothetical protein